MLKANSAFRTSDCNLFSCTEQPTTTCSQEFKSDCLFTRIPIFVPDPNPFLDTSLVFTGTATSLVDTSLTHKALSDRCATRRGLLKQTNYTWRDIASFDRYIQTSYHAINLLVHDGNHKSLFVIIWMKVTYDSILGIPWIRHHGHLI